jgi:hypothetical protein
MAGLEFETADDRDVGAVLRWRLEELTQAGYQDSAALAIATDLEIDLHLAIDLPRRGCPVALAARILL